MAEYRPHRPIAANVHVMQGTLFEEASVCRIGILENLGTKDYLLRWSNHLHSPVTSDDPNSLNKQAQHKYFITRVILALKSQAGFETLPNQFNGLQFSVHHGRRGNQYDLITLKLYGSDQIPIHIVLNR